MTRLVAPEVGLRAGLLEAVADFGALAPMHGSGFWHLGDGVWPDLSPEGCARLVDLLQGFADPATPLPDGLVSCHYYWMVDGDDPSDVVGFLALRHRLTDWLLAEGGHIGYSVRPSRRRRGHATRALGLALERARALGIDPALVTCDDDNEPSRRTIVANGGVLEDVRRGKERYWVPTSRAAS